MTDEPISYRARLEIKPVDHVPRATVRVPGSKSMTNRALVLAALFPPPAGPGDRRFCTLRGALQSEDTQVMIESLRLLGYHVETDWRAAEPWLRVDHEPFLTPRGAGGPPASSEMQAGRPHRGAFTSDLFVANSGTSMRFLTAMVSLGHGRFRLDGVPRMRERPIEDLLAALRQLGVNARSENSNGCPPIVIEANGLRGGPVIMKGDVSSQFLSAVLMVAPLAERPVSMKVGGPLVSEPYVRMTIAMMEQIGLKVETKPGPLYHVPLASMAIDVGRPEIPIEPDASAASYFFAAAAITEGQVRVMGLDRSSLQGDIRFVDVLAQMGCEIDWGTGEITVRGGPLKGIDIDMNDISDTVMTLAVVACFAEGPTTIRNVAHIRHKETDRLTALATELRRIGAQVDEFADGLTITPRPLHGAVIQTYNDHRMAMSLALVGLRVPGVIIDNPGCVAKTYPRFFEDLHKAFG
jgi:3-phosphoshikimate 1-carboxyvinyltransferase